MLVKARTRRRGLRHCPKIMLSKTDVVQLMEFAANKLAISRISELIRFARNTITKYLNQGYRTGHET